MQKLSEIVQNLELLCFNATEEDPIDDKVKEWLAAYPHLRTPATIDLLRETIKTWLRIQRLEELQKDCEDPKQESNLIFRINSLTKTWLTMLGNLGITFTRQQYKSSKQTVQPPLERLKMLTKNIGQKKKEKT